MLSIKNKEKLNIRKIVQIFVLSTSVVYAQDKRIISKSKRIEKEQKKIEKDRKLEM